MRPDHPLAAAALAEPGETSRQPPTPLPHDRRSVTPQEVDHSQRHRLVIATAEVIATRGYAAATIEAIASNAGVSKGSFYKFFASKEEAFIAAYEAMEVVLAHIIERARAEPSLEGMASSVISYYLAALIAAPSLTRLFLFEAMGASPRILRQRAAGVDKFATGFQELIAIAHEREPDITPLSYDLAVSIVGGINELCVHHITLHNTDTLHELHAPIMALIRRILQP